MVISSSERYISFQRSKEWDKSTDHLRCFVQLSCVSSMALNDPRCTRVINMMPINSLIMICLGQLQRTICKQSCVITLLRPDLVLTENQKSHVIWLNDKMWILLKQQDEEYLNIRFFKLSTLIWRTKLDLMLMWEFLCCADRNCTYHFSQLEN